MTRSYAETFFRHRFLLTAPVLIALVFAAAYGMKQPRKYVASATIWTDRRIPADSTIGTVPGSDVPSAGQQALLTSLLTSRMFMRQVALDSPLAGELTGPQLQQDLALARLASTISVATPGPQIMAIAVKQATPELAVGVTAAVVRQFMREEDRRIKSRAGAQVTYDRAQLDAAAKVVKSAQTALLAYTQTHPGVTRTAAQGTATPQTDSAENALISALALAQQQYSEAAQAYTQSTGAMNQATAAALEVLDKPNQAYPQSRKKGVIFSTVGGMLGGLSISVVALLLLVARDRSAREELDLQKALGLRVAGTIGEFSRRRRLPFPSRQAGAPAVVPKGSS